MRLPGVARWLITHTRFVPTHLYRLLVLGAVLSGVAQTLWGIPISLEAEGPNYFDWLFVGLQILAGMLTLTGLYFVEGNTTHASKLYASFTLELVGLIGLQTTGLMNIAAVVLYYNEPPTAASSWYQLVFWSWAWFRIVRIWRAQKELAR